MATRLEELEAKLLAEWNALTPAEKAAAEEAGQCENEELSNAWEESTAAASYGLTIAEYREARGYRMPDPAMWNERDAEAYFGPNPYL